MAGLYIAGPYCFYGRGYEDWWADRKKAEAKGIDVYMPTATPLRMDAEDLRDNAHEIMDDLLIQESHCTAIIADLSPFRGSESDGGTVFELGMLYGHGARLYGHTKKVLPIKRKNMALSLKDGKLYDEKGNVCPYAELPFAPSVTASTKIAEGGFADALNMLIADLREEKLSGEGFTREFPKAEIDTDMKTVYVTGPFRYQEDRKEIEEDIAQRLVKKGWYAVFPSEDLSSDPWRNARLTFEENMKRIERCDAICADLDDFRGYEPSVDVAFECGYAFARSKKLYAFMEDNRCMRARIPNIDGLDAQGCIVENFNYPINLMFSCTFPHIEEAGLDNFENILS